MLILILKSTQPETDRDDKDAEDDEALEKIRAGFADDVKKAKTKQDREHADERLPSLTLFTNDTPENPGHR